MILALLASVAFTQAQDLSLNTIQETYTVQYKDLYIYKWSKRRAIEDFCRDQMTPKVPAGSSIWTVIGTKKETGDTVALDCSATTFTKAEGDILLAYERALDFRPWTTTDGKTVWTRFERLPVAPYFEVRLEGGLSTTTGSVSISSEINFERDSRKAVVTLIPHSRDLNLAEFKKTDAAPTTLEVHLGPTTTLQHNELGALTPRDSTVSFPDSLLFGVATAAHQMEGYTQNSQWFAFETSDRALFKDLPTDKELIYGGGTSSEVDGPNHWDNMDADLQRLVDLKVGAYRFSISWDKLNPKAMDLAAYEKDCQFEKGAAEKYRGLLKFLAEKNIVPVMTLYHFALPRWIAAMGGWDKLDTAKYFARFAECTMKEIAPEVRYVVTLNEPVNHLMGGYQSYDCPPCKNKATDFKGLATAIAHQLSGHFLAYERIKAVNPAIQVGIAHRHDTWVGNPLAAFVGKNWNWSAPDAMNTGEVLVNGPVAFMSAKVKVPHFAKGKQDFYGFNYYTRLYHGFDPKKDNTKKEGNWFEGSPPSARRVSDMGWETYPEGIYDMLKQVQARNKGLPILILENGIGDRSDIDRQRYVQQYLQAVREAMSDGVDVRGYFYWTLLDNFEWDAGYAPKFGLYSVDFKTKARTLRPSGEWYKNVCEKKGFELKQ